MKYSCCATVVTVEELAYASNSIAAVYDVHCILAGHALEYGSDYIKQNYLKPMTTAERIGCFATTEPKASSDLSARSVQTKAVQEGTKGPSFLNLKLPERNTMRRNWPETWLAMRGKYLVAMVTCGDSVAPAIFQQPL